MQGSLVNQDLWAFDTPSNMVSMIQETSPREDRASVFEPKWLFWGKTLN